MPNSIKIEANSHVIIDTKDTIEVSPISSTEIKVVPSSIINAHPRSYKIVGNDVYTIKRNSDLDPWFKDQLDNLINGSALSDEVSDLDNRFQNFADGVTLEVGYLQTKDAELAFALEVLKVSDDSQTAAIQNLNLVKITDTEASAIASTVIGAWQNGAGGAWFEERVSVVSNVAYSAAKSASTLTASIDSQQDQIRAIVGDIDILEKQADGKIETFFSEVKPVDALGVIIDTVEPYASWLVPETRPQRTGDTYVHFEFDPLIADKKNILGTYRFAFDTDLNLYEWYVFEDDLASVAYQNALDAQATADGKSVIYYQDSFPYPSAGVKILLTDKAIEDKLVGDVLVDSSDNNKMWRYNRTPILGGLDDITSVNYFWGPVDDTRISASVNRLDEATVDVANPDYDANLPTGPGNYPFTARAKSSLSVDVNGSIGGFVVDSDGSTSNFKIFADKFTIANSAGSDRGNPFSIDTTTNDIRFNGIVSFANVDGDKGNLVELEDLRDGTTIISGDNILTGFLSADRIDGGVIYNKGADASNYIMKIDLNNGILHIR